MATEHQEDIKKVAALMKGIRFVMLTTVHPDGSLHSRPMTTQDIDFDGDL
jgi:general stress protein 26